MFFLIYETKGLSLEQVDELYGIIDKAWKSKQFRPAVKFSEVEAEGESARHMSLADIAAAQERRRSSVVAGVLAGKEHYGDNNGNGYSEKV